MYKVLKGLFISCAVMFFAEPSGAAPGQKPTIVLVHGAFAESASWNGVVDELNHHGYLVVAAANPLRGVASDAISVSALLKTIDGPVVLVGHSYGGAVISAAANGAANVKALVFVAAFSPEAGESCLALTGKFPGSTLPPTLAAPVKLADGGEDLYIQQDKFPRQFAADLPAAQARAMAATQRPVKAAALAEAAGEPAWKSLPSWSIYGSADLNIPPAAMAWMASRAHAKRTVIVPGASHVVMVSHPNDVAAIIEQAAND
jgi:pimeloyl-ACP methyl ester carboxylesterase